MTEAGEKHVAADNGLEAAPRGKLGVAVRPLTPEEKQQAHMVAGLVVEDSSGAAARAGIQPGDVILAVNGTPVKSVEQLQNLVAPRAGRLAVLVQRGDAQLFIPVTLG